MAVVAVPIPAVGRQVVAVAFSGVVVTVKKIHADPWIHVWNQNVAHRHLETGQIAMFGLAWKAAEAMEAKKRIAEGGGDKKSTDARKKSGPETLPDPIGVKANAPTSTKTTPKQNGQSSTKSTGGTRDIIGSRLGISGKSVDKAQKIVDVAAHVAEKVKAGEISLAKATVETATGKRRN